MDLNIQERHQPNKTLTRFMEDSYLQKSIGPVKTYWTVFFTPLTVHHLVPSIHNICIC